MSRDAGVPTGEAVYWQAVAELYRLQEVSDKTPEQGGLTAWLERAGRSGLGYSEVLELIAPDAATRRDYLAKHFEGVEPAETHRRLAALAERGLVRVFVTTNFDRLLEHALQARGLEPVVVTSASTLEAAHRREHARCYVLKPHGDYLQETIRNTVGELAELDEAVAIELQEIVDRYGVVAMGYSGSDEAVAEALRQRRSRYGLYWLARGDLSRRARGIVGAAGGRAIVRDDAAQFLADLDRRLEVFAAHPSGDTPLTVNDEVVVLLRRADRVGLSELLRRERRELEEALDHFISSHRQQAPTAELAVEAHACLMPVLERRLASLLPLVLYDDHLLAEEVAALVAVREGQPIEAGYTFWPELRDWSIWWLGYVIGGYAMCADRLMPLKPLLGANVADGYGAIKPLLQSMPGDAGDKVGTAVMAKRSGQRWRVPAWKGLETDVGESELIAERYPEYLRGDADPRASLNEFDFVVSLALGIRGFHALSHWSMFSGGAHTLARRLHADDRLRSKLADLLGLTLEEFDKRSGPALEAAFRPGDPGPGVGRGTDPGDGWTCLGSLRHAPLRRAAQVNPSDLTPPAWRPSE